MLVIFGCPIDREPNFPATRHLAECLTTDSFSQGFGSQAWIVEQSGEPPTSGLMVTLSAGEFSLAPGLFIKQCVDEVSDRVELVAMGKRQQLFDIFSQACRLNFCCLHTNRISQ